MQISRFPGLLFSVSVSPCVRSRFDLEQSQFQAEVQREKSQREKLAREKDIITGEIFNLRQQLQVSFSFPFLSVRWSVIEPIQMCTAFSFPFYFFYSVHFYLQDKDTELYATSVKVQQLNSEMQDLSSQESKDEASLAKLKKQLHDLEAKVKDQEEELDEQAGTIQMLEQVG